MISIPNTCQAIDREWHKILAMRKKTHHKQNKCYKNRPTSKTKQ